MLVEAVTMRGEMLQKFVRSEMKRIMRTIRSLHRFFTKNDKKLAGERLRWS